MLNIIFTNIKKNNFTIHFVDKAAMDDKAPKKEIEVFRESKDFFEYFEIPKYQELIIKRLIPDYYFTTIDNWSFDLNVEKILNIYL